MLLPIEINLRSILGTLLIGLLVAVVSMSFRGRTCGCNKTQRVRGDFNSISSALKMYRANNGQLPSTSVGLKALLEKPAGLPATAQWTRLMDDIPLDPWGSPYRYLRDDDDENGFRLFSAGPDKESYSRGNDPDDIASWEPSRPVPETPPEPSKGAVASLIAAVFLSGGLAGIFLRSRPERLFVFAN